MSITTRVVSPDRLKDPQLRAYLGARDAFIVAGGSDRAPSTAVLDGDGNLLEVYFYKDNGVDSIARVRFGANGAAQGVEWL